MVGELLLHLLCLLPPVSPECIVYEDRDGALGGLGLDLAHHLADEVDGADGAAADLDLVVAAALQALVAAQDVVKLL